MSDTREAIKDKLLKRIEDASNAERTYNAIKAFREFAIALRTEADIELIKKEARK